MRLTFTIEVEFNGNLEIDDEREMKLDASEGVASAVLDHVRGLTRCAHEVTACVIERV